MEAVIGEFLGGDVDGFHGSAIGHAATGDFVHAKNFVANTRLVHRLGKAVLDGLSEAVDVAVLKRNTFTGIFPKWRPFSSAFRL